MKKLWVHFQYLALTLDIIRSRFLSVSGAHHAKYGSSAILFATTYSTVITKSPSLTSFNGLQYVYLSFHLTRNFHPFVFRRICLFPFLLLMYISLRLTARQYFKWSITSSNGFYYYRHLPLHICYQQLR